MAPNTKRLFYVNAVSAPVYLEIMAGRPDIQLDKLVNDSVALASFDQPILVRGAKV